jgi:hypothetical protein
MNITAAPGINKSPCLSFDKGALLLSEQPHQDVSANTAVTVASAATVATAAAEAVGLALSTCHTAPKAPEAQHNNRLNSRHAGFMIFPSRMELPPSCTVDHKSSKYIVSRTAPFVTSARRSMDGGMKSLGEMRDMRKRRGNMY